MGRWKRERTIEEARGVVEKKNDARESQESQEREREKAAARQCSVYFLPDFSLFFPENLFPPFECKDPWRRRERERESDEQQQQQKNVYISPSRSRQGSASEGGRRRGERRAIAVTQTE